MVENFKSPVKKLTAFFKSSRDKWKKNVKSHAGYSKPEKRIEFLERSKSELKSMLKELKAQNNLLKNGFNKSENDKKKFLKN